MLFLTPLFNRQSYQCVHNWERVIDERCMYAFGYYKGPGSNSIFNFFVLRVSCWLKVAAFMEKIFRLKY